MDIIIVLIGIGIFAAVAAVFASVIAQSISNSRAPEVNRQAIVLAKRTYVGKESTSYYITFEIQDTQEREEYRIPTKIFSQLIEGDRGMLTTKGTWVTNFVRQ